MQIHPPRFAGINARPSRDPHKCKRISAERISTTWLREVLCSLLHVLPMSDCSQSGSPVQSSQSSSVTYLPRELAVFWGNSPMLNSLLDQDLWLGCTGSSRRHGWDLKYVARGTRSAGMRHTRLTPCCGRGTSVANGSNLHEFSCLRMDGPCEAERTAHGAP